MRRRIASTIHSHAKKSGLPLRVQHAKHMHITTHFIGDVSEKSLTEIKRAFQKSRLPAQGEIILGGKPRVGMFGKDVLYLRVEDPSRILHALKEEGMRIAPVRETHAGYTPHLTLARNPKKADLDPLLELLNTRPFLMPFTPREVLLIHSYERRGKKIHDIIAHRRLPRGKKPL
jgi:2'-5' RNA ligase